MSERITANGLAMPRLGLGTWGMSGKVCQQAVETALGMGYRHIDTAQMYGNEQDVGAALAAAGVPRADIHVTTKVWNDDLTPEGIRRAFEDSLRKLRTEYVDLYLIHWPSPNMDLRAAMEGLMALRRDGRARRVGVANFNVALLRQSIDECGAEIAAEQFEYHAMLRQPKLLEFLRARGIPIIAYSPLAKGRLVNDETLKRIARKHGATAAQVALQWLLEQQDVAVIPKSSRTEGLRENMQALSLRLNDEDRLAIERLPKDRRCVDPGFAPAWDATG
jgi:2,5-diketo-D-gluconate reductase B